VICFRNCGISRALPRKGDPGVTVIFLGLNKVELEVRDIPEIQRNIAKSDD